MAVYQYVVLTRAKPGRAEEFHEWYDKQHLGDCVRHPNIRSARRFRLLHRLDAQNSPQACEWDSLAIYEIESDDPDAVARDLGSWAGTEAMPLTDAFDRTGTAKMIAVMAGEEHSA